MFPERDVPPDCLIEQYSLLLDERYVVPQPVHI